MARKHDMIHYPAHLSPPLESTKATNITAAMQKRQKKKCKTVLTLPSIRLLYPGED